MAKFCPKCGSELKDSDQFCPECGSKFDRQQTKKQSGSIASEVSNSNINKREIKKPIMNKKRIVLIAGIIIVVIAILCVVAFVLLPEAGVGQFKITGVNQQLQHSTIDGLESYDYTLTGTINNLPEDVGPYMIQTEFYDTGGNLIYTDSENLSDCKDFATNGQLLLGVYSGSNEIQMDHAIIKIMDNGKSCGETTYKFNMNNMEEYAANTSDL